MSERTGAFAVEHAEANGRAAGDVSDRVEELNAAAKSANAAGAAIADEEKSFVTGSQARFNFTSMLLSTPIWMFYCRVYTGHGETPQCWQNLVFDQKGHPVTRRKCSTMMPAYLCST